MAPNPHSPDLFLARRAARGDADAWNEIVDRFGERIYNLAYRFARQPAEAEDLTQEIFLKLYDRLSRYRGEMPLVAWTLRLSRNLCIDLYRRGRARQLAETAGEETLAQMPAADDSAARAERRERRDLVESVLAELPEQLALVLTLRDFQGLAYGEIAAFLEVPDGTVKSRLNRARKELVRRLEERLAAGPASLQMEQRLPC